MKVLYRTLNNVLYISLNGELDEYSAKNVRETVDALLEESSAKKIMLDLSKLDFMDSTGIGVILGRYKKLKQQNKPLMIANPSHSIDKILNLSGIYNYMPKVEY